MEANERRLERINEIVQEAYGSGDYFNALAAIEGVVECPWPPDTSA